MSAPELTINSGVAIKDEGATPGTWAAPTMAADALRIVGPPTPRWGYALPAQRENVVTGGYGSPPSAPPSGRWFTCEFEYELTGSGTNDTPPRAGRIFLPFMSETPVVSTSVDYEPSAAAKKTLSVLVQDAGKEYQGRGCVPTSLRIRGPNDDGRIFGVVTLAGILNADPTEQALEAQTFGDQVATPLVFGGATVMSVGGTALIFRSLELDFGLVAQGWRIDRNQAGNLAHGIVTQVRPMIRFPAEVDALATHNPFTRQAAPQTALAFSLQLGSAAGNQYLITGDHIEYDPNNLGLSDENQIRMYDLELGFARPDAGTWFKISHQ